MLKSVWQFRRYLRPYLPVFGLGALLVVAGTLFDLAQPWPLKAIIDGAIGKKPQTGFSGFIAGSNPIPQAILIHSLIVFAVIIGLTAVLEWAADRLMSGAGERAMAEVRASFFSHLQRLSQSFHQSQQVGDLVGRLTLDLDRLQNMLVAVFDTLIPNAVMLLGLAIVMIIINPSFGLLTLAIAPLLFFVTYRYTLRIRRSARHARATDAFIASHATETLSAVRLVQAFSREDHEDGKFAERNTQSLDANLQTVKLKAVFTPLVDVVSLGGTLLVTYVGVEQVLSGKMTLGLLLVFLNYVKSLYRPMRALSKLAWVVSQGTASAERVHEIFMVEERIESNSHAQPAHKFAGAIELSDVTFRYLPGLPTILDHASLRIEAGERIGIVGLTGAGKSTLVSLVPRFYDPEGGSVLIDGIDVRDYELSSLRSQISVVLQEAVLFNTSISENIRYGDPEASMDQVMEAASAAHVIEFLEGMPEGMETRVGERGVKLSGGQRQRIAIARALLADAPILILDEPTNGLDAASELLVLDGLARLSHGKTTLVISHHESALQGLDRVVKVVEGKLIPVAMPTFDNDSDVVPMAIPLPQSLPLAVPSLDGLLLSVAARDHGEIHPPRSSSAQSSRTTGPHAREETPSS
jgi:ATP-binding cassette subfamily B protein